MKQGLLRQLRQRIDRDLPLSREPLTVAVGAVKVDPFNAESCQRQLRVPLRNWDCREFMAFSLADDKPPRPMNKAGEGCFSVSLVAGV